MVGVLTSRTGVMIENIEHEEVQGTQFPDGAGACTLHMNIHSVIHYTLSNPKMRCVAAHILWQPSSLPCLVFFSTMSMKDLSIVCLP